MPEILNKKSSPLADRMRPENFSEFFGQKNLAGEDSFLRQAIKNNKIPSMIFWGPPGSGKTTLAFIIAREMKADFLQISAVESGKKDLLDIVKLARENEQKNKKTILFIDEIHRWNKAQQEALLPHVENGLIILIGATTENPSFELRSALLSRTRVLTLSPLSSEDISLILDRAIKDKKRGLAEAKLKIEKGALDFLAQSSGGDARFALNVLEYLSDSKSTISRETILTSLEKPNLFYDKNGEEHYNIISALHKSMRGSDADAALYWLARMLEGGEDPLYIARRIVRFASEDIGLANSLALEQAVAVYNACHFIGMPECNVILAQAVVYMAKCKKSNELYIAYGKAAQDARESGGIGVPLHLRNAPTKLMKDFDYGKGYKYSPEFDYKEDQEYFPKELGKRKYLK